jgi:hypothetical protein
MRPLDALTWLSVACTAVRVEASSKFQFAPLKAAKRPKFAPWEPLCQGQSKEVTEVDTELEPAQQCGSGQDSGALDGVEFC